MSDPQCQTPADQELKPLRDRIDALDEAILAALNERAQLAQQIGLLKAKADAPVMRPEREAQVIDRLKALSQGPLGQDAITQIFREVMSACRALEHRIRIAYLGPEGTFSEQAVWSHFGRSVDAVPVDSIDEVFRMAEVGGVEFGLVPVENSTEGSVTRTLDLLLQTPLHISGEVSLPIHHYLLSNCAALSDVKEVVAHPQALAQCQHWLRANLPGVPTRAVSSNAEGARLAASEAGVAAIAGIAAKDRYVLNALADGIQDQTHNRTRFLVIGNVKPGPSGRDLTSLILAVPNKPGAVYRMLEPLDQHGVSMTRFESRPARTGRWEYYFYIDVQGHSADANMSAALTALQTNASFYKHLGSYPSVSFETKP
jgi:chorismate mutase/prephenate dehydratase